MMNNTVNRYSMSSNRTKCFGYDEFHIQNQNCNAMPTVYCHDCKLAFCQSCEDEFHFGKRPQNHKRSYTNASGLGLNPCIFEAHQRRQCKDLGVANCDVCVFTDFVCLHCIRIHHQHLGDNSGHIIHQISTENLFPLSGNQSFFIFKDQRCS